MGRFRSSAPLLRSNREAQLETRELTMTPGKWEQAKKIFEAVLPPRLRRVAAAVQCSDTGAGQSETQTDSLPEGEPAPGSERTVTLSAVPRPPQRKTSQSFVPGQIVARRFEILRFLNSGGMGEVYEAWDSELRERVALKTIRPEIASSQSITDRFKQEVKQARVISHVNVCRVYEVFSHEQDSGDRIWFLTMELLEGRTLLECLREEGPFAPKEALELIEQMVAGLSAAHQLGIVHRDFKSSNVMLVRGREGQTRAVVTDFGLALNVLTKRQDVPGVPGQGTPSYMAPEQLGDDPVGFPADQYALGVVICEMITRRLPSRPDGAGGVVLPRDHRLSRRWKAVIRRCLAFRPEERFNEIRNVVFALHPRTQSKRGWTAGGVVALIAMVVVVALLNDAGDGGNRVEGVAQLTPGTDLSTHPSISRDGKTVAYSSDRAEAGNLDIWVQQIVGHDPIRVTTNEADDSEPAISPDGAHVAFRSERAGGGIYVVPSLGGEEVLLAPRGRGPRFSPDGRWIAYWEGRESADVLPGTARVFVIESGGGQARQIGSDLAAALYPVWSP